MSKAKPLTNEEIKAMLDFFKTSRDRCLFILGVKTGFRISELLSLKVQDVIQYGEVRDRITVKRSNVKCKTESRTVVLHAEAKRYLKDYVQSSWHPEKKLFQITRQHYWRLIKGAAEDARVTDQVSPGSMRKSFAQRVYVALDKDLVKTQRALGHKNVTSTVYYLHFDQSDVDNAILGV